MKCRKIPLGLFERPLQADAEESERLDVAVNQHRHVTPPGHHIKPLTERVKEANSGVPFGADRDPTFEADP